MDTPLFLTPCRTFQPTFFKRKQKITSISLIVIPFTDSAVLVVADSTTLDYEDDPSLRLIIEAEAPSGGPVPLYGYATVTINLRDANDNAPHFVQEKYSTSVWESHNAGVYVVQVSRKQK